MYIKLKILVVLNIVVFYASCFAVDLINKDKMPEIAYDKENCPVGIYLNMPEDFYEKSLLPGHNAFDRNSITQEKLMFLVKTYDFRGLDGLIPWSNIDDGLKQLFNHLMIGSQEHKLYMPVKVLPENLVSVFGVYFMTIQMNILNAFQDNPEAIDKIYEYFLQLNRLMATFIKKARADM